MCECGGAGARYPAPPRGTGQAAGLFPARCISIQLPVPRPAGAADTLSKPYHHFPHQKTINSSSHMATFQPPARPRPPSPAAEAAAAARSHLSPTPAWLFGAGLAAPRGFLARAHARNKGLPRRKVAPQRGSGPGAAALGPGCCRRAAPARGGVAALPPPPHSLRGSRLGTAAADWLAAPPRAVSGPRRHWSAGCRGACGKGVNPAAAGSLVSTLEN